MQRRGWWFPSPQEESAVWPSNRRGRDQGSRGERFCEPSLSSASSRWSLLRIRRNKKTPMLVFWVQHSESIFCSRRMANIVLKDLHTQSTVHCTVQPGLTKGKGILWETPSHEQAETRLVKSRHICTSQVRVSQYLKSDPLAGAGQLGHKQAEGQRGTRQVRKWGNW